MVHKTEEIRETNVMNTVFFIQVPILLNFLNPPFKFQRDEMQRNDKFMSMVDLWFGRPTELCSPREMAVTLLIHS